jgi:hypothetical protein
MEVQTIRSLSFTNVKRLKAHDLKFWKHDEGIAHVIQMGRYLCPCRICSNVFLKLIFFWKHLGNFGQHPHNYSWTNVCCTCID